MREYLDGACSRECSSYRSRFGTLTSKTMSKGISLKRASFPALRRGLLAGCRTVDPVPVCLSSFVDLVDDMTFMLIFQQYAKRAGLASWLWSWEQLPPVGSRGEAPMCSWVIRRFRGAGNGSVALLFPLHPPFISKTHSRTAVWSQDGCGLGRKAKAQRESRRRRIDIRGRTLHTAVTVREPWRGGDGGDARHSILRRRYKYPPSSAPQHIRLPRNPPHPTAPANARIRWPPP